VIFRVIVFKIILLFFVASQAFGAAGAGTISEGDVVLITGTSSGLGKEMARLASERRAKLVLVDINYPPSEKLARDINRKGGDAVAIEADLAEPESRGRIIEETVERYGRIDYLINNAAVLYVGPVEDADLEEAHRLFEVNLWAYWDLANRTVPIMREQGGGTILNIASVVGLGNGGSPLIGVYTASKQAVVSLFLSMSQTVAKDNIRIKVACPGGFKSNIFKNAKGPMRDQMVEYIEDSGNALPEASLVAEEIFDKIGDEGVIILSKITSGY